MLPRATTKRRLRPVRLLSILVVLALSLPTAIATAGALPVRAAAPTGAPHASVSAGDAMLAAARASLAAHEGPAAAPSTAALSAGTNWTLLNTTNASTPPARQLQAMAYDPVDDYVVLFGGGNVNPVGQYNDTWVFSNGSWTQLLPNPAPAVRRSASITWDAADGYVVLFGGIDPGNYLFTSAQFEDTWSFLHGVWTNRTAATTNATNTPSVRWNAPMVYDPARGAVVLAGGCNALACASSLNDTWSYLGGAWTNITATVGYGPSVRGTESAVWYPTDQAILLFGGSNPNQTVLGDTWELGSASWTQLSPATSPPPTGDSWMIYDNATGNIVLFGGFRYTVSPSGYAVADTWTYASSTWTNQSANNSVAPSARWGLQQAAAFDTANGCGYLFGGSDSNDVNLGDTWSYGCANTTTSGGSGGSGGGGSGGNMSPRLSLSVTPSYGAAPLFFNASAQLLNATASTNYTLTLVADGPGSSGTAWNDSVRNWDGSTVTVAGAVVAAGSYALLGQVGETVAGTWMPVATANVSLVANGSAGAPPAIVLTVTPANGAAPLNVSLAITPSGGSAPYDLSVCAQGPSSQPNASGACSAIGSQTGFHQGTWSVNDSLSAAGNYTIVASVTDSSGLGANASSAVAITGNVPSAPLAARASAVAPAVETIDGATYAFTTTVSGGVAPYAVQWTFGDGASGSALPGSTIHHTYSVSGTYTASLTVTDAVGHRATATVGPFVVALPLAKSASGSWWGSVEALGLAIVVGLIAAAGIGITGRHLLRRREALNWLREVEEPRRPDEPRVRPK